MNGWSKVFLNGINQIVIEIRRVIELKRINPENANQKMNHYFGLPDNIEKIVAAFERYYKTEQSQLILLAFSNASFYNE